MLEAVVRELAGRVGRETGYIGHVIAGVGIELISRLRQKVRYVRGELTSVGRDFRAADFRPS